MLARIYRCVLLLLLSPLSLFAGEVSYSLVDSLGIPLDEKLVRLMNYTGGVFVEAGAHDGLTQSNTKRLEESHGWTGILVEPSPSLFNVLVANRPQSRCYRCALGSFEQNNRYVAGDFDGSLMSSVDGQRRSRSAKQPVLVRSLQSILDEVGLKDIKVMVAGNPIPFKGLG
jgi:hypothetical protein